MNKINNSMNKLPPCRTLNVLLIEERLGLQKFQSGIPQTTPSPHLCSCLFDYKALKDSSALFFFNFLKEIP